MKNPDYAYLELTNLPMLGSQLLSTEAVVLFDQGLSTPLWANASGADLFGEVHLSSLLEKEFSSSTPFIRQLRDAAVQLENEDPIVRGFRVQRGARAEFTQCILSRVQLPGGERAVMVTCADERLFKPLKEHEVAQKFVASLEDTDSIVAILDNYGLPIAFSPAFADADFSMDALEEMCRNAAASAKPQKSALRSDSGNMHSVGVVMLKTNPGRLLMVAHLATEETNSTSMESETDPVEQPQGQWESGALATIGSGSILAGTLAAANPSNAEEPANAKEPANAEELAGDLELAADIGAEASQAESAESPDNSFVSHDEDVPVAQTDSYFRPEEIEVDEPVIHSVSETLPVTERDETTAEVVEDIERAVDVMEDEGAGIIETVDAPDENLQDKNSSAHWQLGETDWRVAVEEPEQEQEQEQEQENVPGLTGSADEAAKILTPEFHPTDAARPVDDAQAPAPIEESLAEPASSEPRADTGMDAPIDAVEPETTTGLVEASGEAPDAVEPRKRNSIRAMLERWYLGIGGETTEEASPKSGEEDTPSGDAELNKHEADIKPALQSEAETSDPAGTGDEPFATGEDNEPSPHTEDGTDDSAETTAEDNLARSAIEGNAPFGEMPGNEAELVADLPVEIPNNGFGDEPEADSHAQTSPANDGNELLPWAEKPEEPFMQENQTVDVTEIDASESRPASEAGSWLTPGRIAAGAGVVLAGAATNLSGEISGAQGVSEPGPFRYLASGEPVRFAWTVDENHIFMSVSPELAQTVGPNAADIVGRKFSDVANVFGFDRYGDIQRLLEKRDTWSGKSVLWPVQGTDMVVPVDLAALPAFSGARQFDGFRGFGIIRTADAVIDPDETGLALAGGQMRQTRQADIVPAANEGVADIGHDVARRHWPVDGEQEESNISTFPTATGANIVDLGLRKRDRTEELSRTEAKAFKEIGQKLVEDESANSAMQPSVVAVSEPGTADAPAAIPASTEANSVETAQASILRKLPVPVLVYRSAETLYANPELLSVSGYSSTEELAEAGGVDALFASQGIAEGENAVVSLRCKNGSSINVSPLLQTVLWDDAKALLLSFRAPQQALTDEKTAIDMARVAELQNILDTATDGILVTTRDGLIESLNGPAEALFGFNFRDVQNKHLSELFARESHQAVEDYMRELKEPGVAGLINNGREVIGLHQKGGLIPLFITLGWMGNEEKFCAVLRDITPWKKAEEELVTARRAAESASEQKTDFLARVSHEIRTPLNAIIGFSDVMIEERFGPIENDRYRGYLRDINRSGVHVLDLINDLLDISKIEAGKMELSYEAVDLNQLVAETVALLQPQANGERIIIRTSLSRAVPRVVADARSIRQIILNLVSNAIKFTPANGQVIVSTVYEGNGEVVMRVRDTGRGMSEREIEQAMKPFHQINVTDEKRGQGTGLGLPLTKALVEANRAYFDLESTPGEGTIAHVHFPTQRVLAD